MQTIDEMRHEVARRARRGDFTVVAGLVGLKPDTVRRIAHGTRSNKKVLRRFVSYLDKRDELEQQIKGGQAK